MLKISNLSAGYADLPVLKDVSLELRPGTISVLMGPNGAGKSTLLRSVFNLTNITAGQIWYEDTEITGLPPAALLARGLSFVSQGRINFAPLTVFDNLLLGAHLVVDQAEVKRRLKQVYSEFPVLQEKSTALAYTLSGGEQQMLALGRALMSAPRLLLLDEPSLGLSPKLVRVVLVRVVFDKIRAIRDHFNTTVLVVEHNVKSLFDVADYAYVMVQGSIVAAGRCQELKDSAIMKQVFVGKLD